jgi:hypothetical protein
MSIGESTPSTSQRVARGRTASSVNPSDSGLLPQRIEPRRHDVAKLQLDAFCDSGPVVDFKEKRMINIDFPRWSNGDLQANDSTYGDIFAPSCLRGSILERAKAQQTSSLVVSTDRFDISVRGRLKHSYADSVVFSPACPIGFFPGVL